MQPNERRQWVYLQFPHSDEAHAGVRASLAKAKVDILFLLVMFKAVSLVIVLNQHVTAHVALHAHVLAMRQLYITMHLMTALVIMMAFVVVTILRKHSSSIGLQQHARQTDIVS